MQKGIDRGNQPAFAAGGCSKGITIREYFIAQAMSSLIIAGKGETRALIEAPVLADSMIANAVMTDKGSASCSACAESAALRAQMQCLLNVPELNFDDMEPATREIISQCHKILSPES